MSLVPYGQSQELTTVQRRRRSLGSDYGDRYDDRSSDRRDHLRPRRSTRHASPRGSGIGSRRHSRDSYDSSPKSWESRLNDLGKHFMGAKRYIESKHLTETQQISITEGVIEGDWLASGMATALRRSRTGYDPKCTYEEGRKETLCPFREAIDSIDTHLKETGYKMRPEDRRRRKDLLRALRDDHTGQWDSMASTREEDRLKRVMKEYPPGSGEGISRLGTMGRVLSREISTRIGTRQERQWREER